MAKQWIGRIVEKEYFLQNSNFSREEYEGLIVSADLDSGLYNIGVELDDNQVLVVDQVQESLVAARVQQWAPKIQEIQNMETEFEDDYEADEDECMSMRDNDTAHYTN
ncbi:MAG: hypothetical protein LBR98_04460 [Syntrophomonadaceae bacterium]|jgi:hypothetical protein|nr:hypothetical protein [Syntrophomonadaceae bacterium]